MIQCGGCSVSQIRSTIAKKGLWKGELNPYASPKELSRVVDMGEGEYTRVAGQEAAQAIRARPGEFLRSTILRVGYFWIGTPMQSRRLGNLRFLKYLPLLTFSALALYGAGLSLRHKNGDLRLFVAVLFFYPLVYYVPDTFAGT